MKETHVIIVLDKSGSMHHLREATVLGINNFISEVQKEPGHGFWTLVEFDDHDSAKGAGEAFPKVIFQRKHDKDMPKLELADYKPRGGTALIDAVCITIEKTKELFLEDPSKQRKVMFFIVTDGEENSSRLYTNSKLRELTAELEEKHGWKFMYLGANQDAFSEASKYIPVSNDFNFKGLAGVVTSGMVAAGQHTNKAVLQFKADAFGFAQCVASGAIGTRAWKADGNPTVEGLMGNALPDANIQASGRLDRGTPHILIRGDCK